MSDARMDHEEREAVDMNEYATMPSKTVSSCSAWERIKYWFNDFVPFPCTCCHQMFYMPIGKLQMKVEGIKTHVLLIGTGKPICPDPSCQKWAVELEHSLAAWGSAYYLFTPGSCYYDMYNRGEHIGEIQDNEYLQRAWREGRVTVRPTEGFDVTEDYG